MAEYQRRSNNIIMTALGMRTPNQILAEWLEKEQEKGKGKGK
jgi:hypothetical protein